MKREKPQSKQIKTFGKTKTPGCSIFLRPRKWMFISAVNSAWRSDAHDGQFMTHLPTNNGKKSRNACLFKIEHLTGMARCGTRIRKERRLEIGAVDFDYSFRTTPRSELYTCNSPL